MRTVKLESEALITVTESADGDRQVVIEIEGKRVVLYVMGREALDVALALVPGFDEVMKRARDVVEAWDEETKEVSKVEMHWLRDALEDLGS